MGIGGHLETAARLSQLVDEDRCSNRRNAMSLMPGVRKESNDDKEIKFFKKL